MEIQGSSSSSTVVARSNTITIDPIGPRVLMLMPAAKTHGAAASYMEIPPTGHGVSHVQNSRSPAGQGGVSASVSAGGRDGRAVGWLMLMRSQHLE